MSRAERNLTQEEIDDLWYRVERRMREKGRTLAVFVTADGRPMIVPPVELPEERRVLRPDARVAELERQVAELQREKAALQGTAATPVIAPEAESPSAAQPKLGLLGSIRALVSTSPMTVDEIVMALRESNRTRVASNVSVAVCRGKLIRIGQGRSAQYAVKEMSA